MGSAGVEQKDVSARWNKESKKEVLVATFLLLTSKSPYKGARSLVTYGDRRTREVPPDAAKGSMSLMTLPPRRHHARIVQHYHDQ